MSLNKDDVLAMLRGAGIPPYVARLNLAQPGYEHLRQWVIDKGYINDTDERAGLWLYPTRPSTQTLTKARNGFYALAKTLLLARETCLVFTLADMIGAISRDGDMEREDLLDRLETADHLFIVNFYEAAATPFDGWVSAYLRNLLSRRHEAGKGLFLYTDTKPDTAKAWWPEGFLNYLSSRIQPTTIE